MLTLTKRTEYALIATCHLAQAGRKVTSARGMADIYGVRLPLLMNVLKTLNQQGILRSVRGACGGYALAVGPKELTLARLLEVIEGTPRLTKCAAPQPDDDPCELMGKCPVRVPLKKVHRLFDRFLREVTVADLAFDDHFGVRKGRGVKKAGSR